MIGVSTGCSRKGRLSGLPLRQARAHDRQHLTRQPIQAPHRVSLRQARPAAFEHQVIDRRLLGEFDDLVCDLIGLFSQVQS